VGVVLVEVGHVEPVRPACPDPKKPPGDPERRERMGACDRKRFLEAVAWECSAGESLHADRTLCGPRPNA
jgi:hypothetical protein